MLNLTPPRKQHGVVLIMALIVLVALTLAALALTRSVYTSNAIAGNLAFQQATTHAADEGIEDAINWLETNNGQTTSTSADTCTVGSTVLACDQPKHGYFSAKQDPTGNQTWADVWATLVATTPAKTLGPDNAGNTVSYVIQRMCSSFGDSQNVNNDCTIAPAASASTCSGGSSCDAQKQNLSSVSQIYYRITVRVSGPRNTQSFVQSLVAM